MVDFACRNCRSTMLYIEHNRSPYCEAGACQRARVQANIIQHAQNAKAAIANEGEKYLSNSRLSATTPFTIAILPANNKDLLVLSSARKKAFLKHIRAIYQDIEQVRPNAHETYQSKLNEQDPQQIADLLGKACATCKGHCCGTGGNHAYQDYGSLKMFLIENASLNEESVAQLYASYLPNESYEFSCIFQANKGCTLPNNMRSITCRNHKCDGLSHYESQLKEGETNLTVAGAVNGSNVLTIAVFSQKGFSYL